MIKTIQSGNVTASIDTKGAQLISLQKDGKEYVWQRDPEFWEDCAPVLFPVVGRCRNGKILIKGEEYPMDAHGFVQNMELEVYREEADCITFALRQNEETKKSYPWDFFFTITFRLDGNQLITEFKVENTDKETIWFGIGGHPGFNVPMNEGEKFEDYQLEFETEEILYSNRVLMEDVAILPDGKDLILESGRVLPLKRALFNNDALIFEDIHSKWVKLVHKDTKAGLHFAYEDFPILAIWTRGEPVEAPYVCLEPWFGMGFRTNEGDDIEKKYGIQNLEAGKVFTASFTTEIID
ncbi:MAG: aldose 1-epimerase family protein [Clostridia bacterium]|nr:aldose 1-epimerase family protein [Clostridia bacterium]